uniref:NADH dehydrogenase subunit 4L n=1 Tax=Diximermis spiculatus TaxID=3313489 RepID=Q1HBB4_9BILA|nr:NADH dehydrogenase subunit 4L [Strelkovimermis spiculatus]ABF48166.1 NADH dehydrogenase subunit 4L [Strelkovimermis spiculatus]ABF48178.1 NADH dehydrogenase subunit 4L [Strelkovimermis spiculatus]
MLLFIMTLMTMMKNYSNLIFYLITMEVMMFLVIIQLILIMSNSFYLIFMFLSIQVSDSVLLMVLFLKNSFFWVNLNMWYLL